MKKKKLLVILGAGSSVSIGMPSVPTLDKEMKEWASRWKDVGPSTNFFNYLWDTAEALQNPVSPLRRLPNFEKILGEMVALIQWMTPKTAIPILREVACHSAMPPDLVFRNPNEYGPLVEIQSQLVYLLDFLAKRMRESSRSLDTASPAWKQYVTIFNKLRESFDIGVYNLNYDTAAITAWRDAATGFNENSEFDAQRVHADPRWGFVYHLHGSVHHSLAGIFSNEVVWRDDLSGAFEDCPANLSADPRSDGKALLRSTLVAGGFKLDQLLVEPFHSFHAALVRHAYEADAILIGGYGFADVHVNRALRNRLATSSRVPVLILDWADPSADPMQFRQDAWTYELCQTLHVDAQAFAQTGYSSPSAPEELVKAGKFDEATAKRVAIWYGGFTGAAPIIDRVVDWLSK